MTRVSENQLNGILLNGITTARKRVNKFAQEITSGYKVQNPGDSNVSGTISKYRESLSRIEGFKNTTTTVKASLNFQDDVLNQGTELLIRAKEIGQQGANETLSASQRQKLSEELFQIRDHMVTLANSTYNGRYLWGGLDDDDPPFDAQTYANPATGLASQRYVYDSGAEHQSVNTVQISDDLTINVNTRGDTVWSDSIAALERMGRALAGYATNPAAGAPDGTGNAYVQPTDYTLQTTDIRNALDLLDQAREQDIIVERVNIGGRLRRIDTAESVLGLAKAQAEDVLDKLQNTDVAESGTNLTEAQTALQASLTVTTNLLRQSILDYL